MDRVNVNIRPFKSKSGHCNALISLMRKHTEERCLARPVWTDQSDFFAGIQLKGSIHEEQLLAILLIDV